MAAWRSTLSLEQVTVIGLFFFFLTLRSVKYISKRRFMRNPGRANVQVRMQKRKTGGRV